MCRRNKQIGGFVAVNTGKIHDCDSAVLIKAGGPAGGFCAENKGEILRCLFSGKFKRPFKEKSGLCIQQAGSLRDSLWIKKECYKERHFSDLAFGLNEGDLTGGELPEVLHSWDLDKIWQLENGNLDLVASETELIHPVGVSVVEISSKADLVRLAEEVNDGAAAPGTVYCLTKDINLRGKKWTPIGLDPHTPFNGIFLAGGHTIKNFRINTAKHPYSGLFGCVGAAGEIHGLTVDCVLTGRGTCSGPICGRNEGTISLCVARARTSPSRYTGGFAGQNIGTITRSFACGSLTSLLIPWWLLPLFLILISISLSVLFCINGRDPEPEIFAPIIMDPNANPIEDNIPAPNDSQLSNQNATFIMNAEMSVSTKNYAGFIGLRSPSWSNRGFVATVRATRADLAAHGIQSTGDYVTIYQSGLIQPGYGIDVITLGSLPDGTRLPAGTYEFSVLFEFYDVHTNEKSAVDATAPLDVTIH